MYILLLNYYYIFSIIFLDVVIITSASQNLLIPFYISTSIWICDQTDIQICNLIAIHIKIFALHSKGYFGGACITV